MERLHAWAIGLLGAAVACVLAALVASDWKEKAWASLVLGVALAVIAVLLMATSWASKPRLRLSIGEVEGILFTITPPQPADLAKLYVTNEPLLRNSKRAAESVIARISFLDEAGAAICEPLYGRWSEIPQNRTYEETGAPVAIAIRPNRVKHQLELAVAFVGSDDIYASTDRTRFTPVKLGPAPVLALVELSGQGIEKSGAYRISIANRTMAVSKARPRLRKTRGRGPKPINPSQPTGAAPNDNSGK